MSARMGMAIDMQTCVACAACVVACKTENDVADGFARDWITTELVGQFPALEMEIRSERCNHCEDAPCVTACPTGASFIGVGGTVQVDADKCTGCKACIAACPYDARFVDPRTNTVDKCTFCAHRANDPSRPNGWTTACQDVCPTRSIVFGDLNDPTSEVSQALASRKSHTLLPEAGTRPKVFYLE